MGGHKWELGGTWGEGWVRHYIGGKPEGNNWESRSRGNPSFLEMRQFVLWWWVRGRDEIKCFLLRVIDFWEGVRRNPRYVTWGADN